MSKHTVFDTDNIGKLLLKLTVPAFIGMAVISLYNVVDTIFVGQYVGKLGIAALSIVFPIQMLSMGVGHLTGMGGASLISMSIGKGDKTRAEKILGNAITPTIVFRCPYDIRLVQYRFLVKADRGFGFGFTLCLRLFAYHTYRYVLPDLCYVFQFSYQG